jgi:hypothetical protein
MKFATVFVHAVRLLTHGKRQDMMGFAPVPTLVPQGFVHLINCTGAACICDAADSVRGPTTTTTKNASLGACAHHRQLPLATCAVKTPYCSSQGVAPALTTGLGFDAASVRYVAPCLVAPCTCRPFTSGDHACYSSGEATNSRCAWLCSDCHC